MEPKLIKENMTKGEWSIKKHNSYVIETNEGAEICATFGDCTSEEEDISNRAAIVSAVNNTWGKGINPEKVEEMYDMLDLLLHHSKMSYFNKQRVTELLTSAKL